MWNPLQKVSEADSCASGFVGCAVLSDQCLERVLCQDNLDRQGLQRLAVSHPRKAQANEVGWLIPGLLTSPEFRWITR